MMKDKGFTALLNMALMAIIIMQITVKTISKILGENSIFLRSFNFSTPD